MFWLLDITNTYQDAEVTVQTCTDHTKNIWPNQERITGRYGRFTEPQMFAKTTLQTTIFADIWAYTSKTSNRNNHFYLRAYSLPCDLPMLLYGRQA